MGTPGPIPSPRTMLGPLTTTWRPPALCTYPMANCDEATRCTTLWQGQSCNPDRKAHDWTDCWPPRTSGAPFPGVMMGWGLYSPAYQCPEGYTTAASAVEGGRAGWDVQFSMERGETALACCPSTIVATSTTAQTCIAVATSSTFSTVQCVNGVLKDYGQLTVPGRGVASTYTLFAPLIQLNYRAQDLASSGSGAGAGGSSIPSETGTSTPLPSSSDGSGSGNSSSSDNNNNNNNNNNHNSSGDQGGLTLGTKVGIGIGAVFALVITGLLLFFMRRALQRRRANKPIGEMLPDEKKGIPGQPELEGAEINELDDTSRPQELSAVCGDGGAVGTATGGWGSRKEGIRPGRDDGVALGYNSKEETVFELEGSSAATWRR
ncbi:hypothetical protein MCOR10_004577 [Pyricularia oryzae]|nr:hypothetical protein MCOR10_004577 [Pyricularia oryzae]KAI6545728.1 hypothetical protein MCOR05_001208 [Pyricularia oryzae]